MLALPPHLSSNPQNPSPCFLCDQSTSLSASLSFCPAHTPSSTNTSAPLGNISFPCPEASFVQQNPGPRNSFTHLFHQDSLIHLSFQYNLLMPKYSSHYIRVFVLLLCLIHDPLPLEGVGRAKRLSSVKEVSTRHYDYMKKILKLSLG